MSTLTHVMRVVDAQKRHVGDLYWMNDEIPYWQVERLKSPPRALRGHVYDGQPRPIGEYFPKVTK